MTLEVISKPVKKRESSCIIPFEKCLLPGTVRFLKTEVDPCCQGLRVGTQDTGHSECLMGTEFELGRWNESLHNNVNVLHAVE